MKVFDYLHQELCVAVDKEIPRYGLWTVLAMQNAHPSFDLTPEKAADYLEHGTGKHLDQWRHAAGEKKWTRLVKQVRRFNPEQPTPDEVMERICGTFSRK